MTDLVGVSLDDVEVLVHVAAPARAADDALYRQLAQAYLDFQPGDAHRSVIALGEEQSRGSNPGIQANEPHAERARDTAGSPPSQSQPDSDRTSPVQPSHIIIDSQELSFQSVEDNRSSPRLKWLGKQAADKASSPASRSADAVQPKRWETPPSQIADSYPVPSTTSLYASPTRVLQQCLGLPASRASDSPRGLHPPTSSKDISSTPTSPSPRRSPRRHRSRPEEQAPHPSQVPTALPESAKQLSKGPVGKVSQKIIPVTPLVPKTVEMAPEDSVAFRARQAIFDITHVSSTDSSLPVLPSSSRGESEPPPAKRPKTSFDSTAQIRHDAAALIRSASDVGPSSSPSSSNLSREQLSALEVFAPSPPVGIGNLDPSNMIPENLAKLADKLSSRYRPTATRDLDPLERGFWAVDCSSWSSETRRQTWVFLFRYIETGMASWGVWCRRSPDHDSLRLYCWGHLIKHTYLLLYLASERALKYTGADWKDAEGEVVLQVHPIEKRLRE